MSCPHHRISVKAKPPHKRYGKQYRRHVRRSTTTDNDRTAPRQIRIKDTGTLPPSERAFVEEPHHTVDSAGMTGQSMDSQGPLFRPGSHEPTPSTTGAVIIMGAPRS